MAEPKTTVGGAIKKAGDFVLNPLGAIAQGAADAANPEPDPNRKTEQVDRAGRGTPSTSGSFSINEAPKLPEPKVKPSGITLTGTQVASLSEENQATLAQANKNLQDAEYLGAAEQLRALKVGENEQRNLNFVNENASDLISDLRVQHFPKARVKMEKLQRDVDDARAMRINPYNWHESIGRGGRVAAAFSLLTGQMAAGAGNPNTALQMMDAAINRDIAAQDQNIKNQFEASRLQRGLLQDERELFTEELTAINTNRAVAYAAIVGRIQFAEQHAITETARLSLRTMKDHYNVRLLQAIAAANAQYQTLHVKIPLTNAGKAAQERQLKKISATQAALQAQLDASVARQPSVQGTQGAVRLSTGESAEDIQGMLEGRPAQPAPAGQPAEPALPAAPGRGATVASRRPSKGRRPSAARGVAEEAPADLAAPGTEPRRIAPDRTRETIPERDARLQQEAAAAPVRTLENVQARIAAGQTVTKHDVANVLSAPSDQGGSGLKQGKRIGKAGGFAMLIAEEGDTETSKITRIEQAINASAAGRPIPNNGMQHPEDANIVSTMIPPPLRSEYRAGPDGDILFNKAMEHWDHGKRFPETFEAAGSISGQRNNIQAGGRDYRILRASPARHDPGEYTRIEEDMIEMAAGVELLETLAESVLAVGPSGLWAEDGFQIPGLTSDDPRGALIGRREIEGAMQFIKQNDPTARISDQDIKLGKDAMGMLSKGSFKLFDFMQSFAKGQHPTMVRRTLARYFQALAISAQETYWKKYQNHLVPNQETERVLRQKTAKTQRFMVEQEKLEEERLTVDIDPEGTE